MSGSAHIQRLLQQEMQDVFGLPLNVKIIPTQEQKNIKKSSRKSPEKDK